MELEARIWSCFFEFGWTGWAAMACGGLGRVAFGWVRTG